MVSKRSGDKWSDPVDSKILPDSLVAAHPALSADGLTLYFVSDMPGGSGLKDIYSVTRDDENDPWSTPRNLGPDINTRGNELFPFIRDDGILYFASDGQIGMGGLDIFKAAPQPDGSWVVQNMKSPLTALPMISGSPLRMAVSVEYSVQPAREEEMMNFIHLNFRL